MKKAANLVDKALEVARKARGVPKKPVKTKGKKTVPEALDWGPGIPLDKLAYLNDDEMALVQAKRMFKGKRDYRGIPAFPDPGDTAAGDPNDSGGSTYGGGGGSDSGAGGDGGMGSYNGGDSGVGGGTGGGSDSGGDTSGGVGGGTGGGSDSGAGSSAGAGAGGGSDSGAGSTASTTGGTDTSSTSGTSPGGSTSPTSGSLSQPARTEASSYAGPSAVSAPTPPSSYQTYGGYDPTASAPSSMASEATLDRIASGSSVIGNTTPQGYATPPAQQNVAPVSYSQTPTVSLSNLADPNLQQAADYSFAQNNQWSGLSGYGSLNTPQETAMSQPTQGNVGYGPTPNSEMSGIVAGDPSLRATGTPPQGYAQTGRVLNTASLGYPVSPLTESTPPTQETVGYSPTQATTNVFYSSPAEQAADVRRAVALAQGPASTPTEIDIPGGDIGVNATPASAETAPTVDTAAGEYDYDPTKDPANYMRPIYPGDEDQAGYMTDEQRTSYLNGLGGTRSSERPPSYYYKPEKQKQEEEDVVKKKKKPPVRKDPKYVYRDYMYTDYGPLKTKPDSDIADFNRYNQQNFNKGGRIGDSVQAALRIAKSKLL